MSEDKVPSLRRLMARKTGLGLCFVHRFTVCELSKSPAFCCGVSFGILNHELNIHGRAGNERLLTTKDFVVFFRWNVVQAAGESASPLFGEEPVEEQ
jgi:hypothetical protein